MPDTNPQQTLDTSASEFRINRFEAAWLAWRPGESIPRWQEYLPDGEGLCNPALIFDLMQIDIEYRIKAGMPALLFERYFEHPRLQKADARLDAALQVELIHWEYQQRWDKGDRARRAEYATAFPQHADALHEMRPCSPCPRCHKIIVLEETDPSLRCPDCETDLLRTAGAPPFVAVTTTEMSPQFDVRAYQLMEELGKGGMGEVHRCCDPALGRELAIKVMKLQYRGIVEAERRFLREARITGSLQHPGIVPVHNLGRLSNGRLHYTMRLVRGRTFADILKEEAGQPERVPYLLSIFEKICQAVAYAHSKRVLHRDLKPQNVMVGRFGEVQVMDWGLAKVLSPDDARDEVEETTDTAGTSFPIESDTPVDLSRMGSGFGTPAYMPPEQALGEWNAVDERADVFALGSILCEILTGEPAYRGTDGLEVYRRAKRGDVTEALSHLHQCGADAPLKTLCRECLIPDREARPRDADAVAKRVAEYQADVQERLRQAEIQKAEAQLKAREARKQRRLLIALVLALLAGGTLSTWQAVRATSERNDKEIALGKAEAATEAERQAKLAEESQRHKAEEQKQLAENNERKAKESEADTKAVLTFFQDKVLAAGRPKDRAGGLGRNVTLHLVVDQAEKDITDSFKDRPLVEASIRNTLGSTYSYLGDAPLAIRQFERALALREDKLGPDHLDTLISQDNLAVSYWEVGRTADAIRLYEQTLKQLESKFEPDHPDTLISRNNLANAYLSAGRTKDAIRLHEQTLKQKEIKLGLDHPNTFVSRNNLAAAYRAAGRFTEAIRLHEQTLKQCESLLGLDHPETLDTRNGLAEAYLSAGRTAEAIRLHEQTLKQREASLGSDHPTTLMERNNLAEAYGRAGRIYDAIRLHELILKQKEAKLGPDHPSTLLSRGNLAAAYQSAGRTAEAIPLQEQTLKQKEAKLGPDHPDTLLSRSNLASAYHSAGRTTEAIRLHEQSLKQMETNLGLDHPSTLTARDNLALAYRSAGRIEDAIRLHELSLKQREVKLGADHPDTLTSRHNLANAYRAAGRTADAIRLHEQNLKLCESTLGLDHPHTLILMGNLSSAYRDAGRLADAIRLLEAALDRGRKRSGGFPAQIAWLPGALALTYEQDGQFAKAEAFYRGSLEQARRRFGNEDPRTAEWMAGLGSNLLHQQKYSDAESLLRECLKVRAAKQADNWATFNARSMLGAALLGQKKYVAAEPLLLQGYEGMQEREAKIPPEGKIRLTEALERLVQLYEATGNKTEAAKWRKRLDGSNAAQKKPKS
jgi:serine/threonine protein kinase